MDGLGTKLVHGNHVNLCQLVENAGHEVPEELWPSIAGHLSAQPRPLERRSVSYDSDRFRAFLADRGTRPEIKQDPTRKRLHPFDKKAYRGRNVVERAFCFLKDWRRVATRYDKLTRNFAATVTLPAIIRWWA